MKIRRKHVRYAIIGALVLILLGVLLIEIVGRVVGLTDPPLLVSDPDMEYRFAPDQVTRQFGRRVVINQYSQRSEPLEALPPDGLRILVLGDSVAWGGTQIDQDDLATTRLQHALAEKLNRPVQVLNASAGSWGYENQLAYVNHFGDFNADLAIIITSTQDADDLLTGNSPVGRDPSFPDSKPWSATYVVLTRYLPRYLAILEKRAEAPPAPTATTTPAVGIEADPKVLEALTALITRLRSEGRPMIVVMHPQRDEASAPDNPAWRALVSTAEAAGARVFDARPTYRAAGGDLYRDNIHPTPAGQRVLSDALLEAVEAALRELP